MTSKIKNLIDFLSSDKTSPADALDVFNDVMKEKSDEAIDSLRQLAFEGVTEEDEEDQYEECDCEEGDEDCNCEEVVTEAGRKIVVKVDSKGKRRKKLVCGPGKKSKDGKCVVQKSSEKIARKKGLKKAVRSKKAGGAGAKRKANIKRNKALKKRKSQGL